MAEHRFQFDWDVPAAGYLWVTATSIGGDTKLAGPALVGRDLLEPAAAAGPPRKPEPHPLLFRLLAETSPDEGGILTFASRYGNLFSPGNDLALSGRRARHSPAGVRGVFLAAWQYHIAEMRRLTELWDRVHGEDEEALAPHIRWVLEPPEGPSVYFDRHPARTAETGRSEDAAGESELIASGSSGHGAMERFRPGDVLLPARAYLGDRLDALLFDAVHDVTFGMTWDISPGMTWDRRRERPVFSFICPTLMSAVWLQFATVVSENLAYGRCRVCGTWFEVAPRAARSSRQFCSTSCRSKAYRDRQDSARRMYTAGQTFEAIAEALESDVATVRKWITGIKDNSGH